MASVCRSETPQTRSLVGSPFYRRSAVRGTPCALAQFLMGEYLQRRKFLFRQKTLKLRSPAQSRAHCDENLEIGIARALLQPLYGSLRNAGTQRKILLRPVQGQAKSGNSFAEFHCDLIDSICKCKFHTNQFWRINRIFMTFLAIIGEYYTTFFSPFMSTRLRMRSTGRVVELADDVKKLLGEVGVGLEYVHLLAERHVADARLDPHVPVLARPGR